MKRRRILIWIAAIVVGLCALLFGLVTLIAFQALRPPRWALKVSPKDFGLAYEDVRFPASDGTDLAGWWVPAKNARGTIILCHGYPANRSDVQPLIPFLHAAGYDVLAFDFRRLGESGGDVCTLGLREPRDLNGAVTYAKSRSSKPVGVLGVSMGAGVALMEAADDPRVAAVVADSPFVSMDVQAPRRFGNGFAARMAGAYACWLGGKIIDGSPADVSPLRAVPCIAPRPILVIHGDADRIIPDADSRAIYAAAGEPKELWIVPGSAHIQAFNDARPEYERRVLAFFGSALK